MFQSVRSGFDVPDAFAVITDRSVGGKFPMRAVLRIDERIRLSRNACLISLAVRPVRILFADLITLAAAFAQYDALQVLKSNFDLAKT